MYFINLSSNFKVAACPDKLEQFGNQGTLLGRAAESERPRRKGYVNYL